MLSRIMGNVNFFFRLLIFIFYKHLRLDQFLNSLVITNNVELWKFFYTNIHTYVYIYFRNCLMPSSLIALLSLCP